MSVTEGQILYDFTSEVPRVIIFIASKKVGAEVVGKGKGSKCFIDAELQA